MDKWQRLTCAVDVDATVRVPSKGGGGGGGGGGACCKKSRPGIGFCLGEFAVFEFFHIDQRINLLRTMF